MDILNSIEQMQKRSISEQANGKSIVLVPTMGFLHSGHQALLKEGRKRGDILVLSIFVNPTQFAPGEDLESYPSNIEKDLEIARSEGVDIVFLPDNQTIYPTGYQTYVSLDILPNFLCGKSRPTHFKGVATVVTKLFHIVQPRTAIFGQKDFQQLAIIRRMVEDLNFNIDIIGVPTVRESNGLAMSSRNAYLADHEKKASLCLIESIEKAQKLLESGEKNAEKIIETTTRIIQTHPEASIDYLSICDPETLETITEINKPVVFALAVKIGSTRLIDNAILRPE